VARNTLPDSRKTLSFWPAPVCSPIFQRKCFTRDFTVRAAPRPARALKTDSFLSCGLSESRRARKIVLEHRPVVVTRGAEAGVSCKRGRRPGGDFAPKSAMTRMGSSGRFAGKMGDQSWRSAPEVVCVAIPQSLVHYWPRSVRTSFPAEDRSPLTNINATKAEAA
jgi:hypothetical protein